LSTARNELGVIFAKSVAGHTMIPISWDTMQCPKTKMKEYRKVAKPMTIETTVAPTETSSDKQK
jgi:exosome complex component CSL4